MNTYEILKRLSTIIGDLTQFYGKLSNELPQICFVRTEELKKRALTTCYPFR